MLWLLIFNLIRSNSSLTLPEIAIIQKLKYSQLKEILIGPPDISTLAFIVSADKRPCLMRVIKRSVCLLIVNIFFYVIL